MSFPSPVFVPSVGGFIPPGVQALEAEAMTILQPAFVAAQPVWPLMAQELAFDLAGKVILHNVDDTYDFKAWNGTPGYNDIVIREVDLQAEPYVAPVAIDAFALRDDRIKAYGGRFAVMAQNMAMFPDYLLAAAMIGGTSFLWYDGQDFYSAAHPINPEAPAQFGTQSNYNTGTPLTWVNVATLVRPQLEGMLKANGRPWNQGAGVTHQCIVPTAYTTYAEEIFDPKASLVPTSIVQLDNSTYGTASTSNMLKGYAKVITMVDLNALYTSTAIPWFLNSVGSSPFAPFGIGMREAFKIIPLTDERLPLFTSQHKVGWFPYGRMLATPTVYQNTILSIA